MSKLWNRVKSRFKHYLARVAKENHEQFGDEPLRGYNLNKRAFSKKDDEAEE